MNKKQNLQLWVPILLLVSIFSHSCKSSTRTRLTISKPIQKSKEKISKLELEEDTIINYWQFLGKIQFPVVNAQGTPVIYSVLRGKAISIDNDRVDTFKIRNLDIQIKTHDLYSSLIDNRFIYFILNSTLYRYNINLDSYELIKDLSNAIIDNRGVKYIPLDVGGSQSPCIVYWAKESTLIFPVWSANDKHNHFLGSLDLKTYRVNVLNIERPPVDYPIQRGMQDNTMYVVDSNNLFVSFAYSKVGLKVNLESLALDTLNVQSTLDTLPELIFTPNNYGINDIGERFMKTVINSAFYGYQVFNPFKKHYYKIFYKQQALKDSSGLNTTLASKRLVLMIMDRQMRIIKEIELGPHFNWVNDVIPTKNGVMLLNASNSGNYNLPDKSLLLRINYE